MKSTVLFRVAALSGVLTLAPASIALAANFGANTPLHLGSAAASSHSNAPSGGSIVRTIVGLAIVIALIYGLSWIIRQAKASKNPATGAGLTQVASLPLGTGRSVSLVRVGSELHLLGVAEHGVTRIRTFTQEEAVAAGLPVSAAGEDDLDDPPPPIVRAVDMLRRLTSR
jgi:flagellar protein FliO/FliZ